MRRRCTCARSIESAGRSCASRVATAKLTRSAVPPQAWKCLSFENVNATFETGYLCDCDRYYSCGGPDCSEPNVGLGSFFLVCALLTWTVAVPTLFRAARAVYKVHKAGKNDWGASVIGLIYLGLSQPCGMYYEFNAWCLRFFTCAQGTSDTSYAVTTFFTSMYALFSTMAIIQIVLLWSACTRV